MSLRDWFQPPRSLIALFLLISFVPSILLMAFGWRLIVSDRALQARQVAERREQAADLLVSALDQRLAGIEQALRDPASVPGLAAAEDAVAVVFSATGVDAFPRGRLLYYPRASPGREAPAEVFADGEHLEHRVGDAERAAAVYRRLARSPDEAIRAGALIRLAATRRRQHDVSGALQALAGAATADGVAHGGIPADLLARWGRCELFASLPRQSDLQQEAAALYRDLAAGRWQLDRATFALHMEDVERWGGRAAGPAMPGESLRLAKAVEWLWNAWQDRRPSGREAILVDGSAVTVLWQSSPGRLAALVAAPRFVQREWVSKLDGIAERQQVRVTLHDRGHRPSTAAAVRRAAGDTALPWTLVVEPRLQPGNTARLTAAQTLWLAGLAILATLVVAGTWVIGRAVSRELAVARLQTDFVSAVSHEFRTPLTSLRQLTEMLIDRPAIPEDRRRTYYEALARQTERLHRLVESLLDFGRMEAGRQPYRLEPLDAATLVGGVVEQFAGEVSGRGYAVELRIVSNGAIDADREALTNALWNLLDNAVKYSPHCTTVWVEVGADAGRLAIDVRDRGLGIPRDEHQEIFRKFVRGAAARAGHIKGTGIGLAMVQHIVEAHGGTVTVASAPGEGSTFTIRLPLRAEVMTVQPAMETVQNVERT